MIIIDNNNNDSSISSCCCCGRATTTTRMIKFESEYKKEKGRVRRRIRKQVDNDGKDEEKEQYAVFKLQSILPVLLSLWLPSVTSASTVPSRSLGGARQTRLLFLGQDVEISNPVTSYRELL